jgi:EAL domain-containing protein (putative c-di-GMP-specific phosphodiesterase class I)
MHTTSDLMLILESDPDSTSLLCAVADRLGCEHVESESLASLNEILSIRRPTIAVLAVDLIDTSFLAAIDALSAHDARPAVLLVGSVGARVLASAKRTAESRGLTVLDTLVREVDANAVEKLLTPQLSIAPPILREELKRALVEHELQLHYQPKLTIGSTVNKVQGVEALVRWQHPRRGLLQPRHFLSAIEEHGLMSSLTDFVMTEAVRQAAQWRAHELPLDIIVNLSTRLVEDRDFPERLTVLLRENDFPPQQLILDVTESSSALDQNLVLDVFTRLRILGVGLSLDNFGTGSSSLTELYRMPFSEVKVDHSLIADVPREREARVVVKAIAKLAHALRLAVCAEGVETRQMLEFVRSAGFDTAQGRFFSEPVPAGEIEQIVRGWPAAGPSATGSWKTKSLNFDGSVTTNNTRALRAHYLQGKFPT